MLIIKKTHYKLLEQQIMCSFHGYASTICKQDYFSISKDEFKVKNNLRS